MHTLSISRIAFAAADASTGAALAIGDAVAPVTPEATGPVANVPAKPDRSNVAATPRKRAAKPEAAATTGKRAKPAAKPEAEAKPDPRFARAERIATERTDIAALYAGFEANRVSIPVKTLSAFKPEASTAHPISRNPSQRQAAAICVAFAAANTKLADGAKAPRVFERNGVRVCIENGVMRDAISSGLIRVTGSSPETEMLVIAAKQTPVISGLIGGSILKRAKLV